MTTPTDQAQAPRRARKLMPIFSAPEDIAARTDESLIKGLLGQFPVEGKTYRLTLENVRPEHKTYTLEDEKNALLQSKSLTYPIKGDLKLIDKATGQVVSEQKDFSLMDSFHLTGKHTMIYKGNNYSVANQLQLLPGAYTRSRETGELETHFNTGSGRSFAITLDPQSYIYYIEPSSSSSRFLALPLLTHVFAVSPTEIARYVPAEVVKANVQAAQGKEDKTVADLYKRLVSVGKQQAGASLQVMSQQLAEALQNSKLNAKTTTFTLGKALDTVTHEAILLALKNLAEVHAGTREEDNRDSLQYKRVQNLPDFLATRFSKDHQVVKSTRMRIARELDRLPKEAATLRGSLTSKPFNKFFTNYILESNLVSTPQETNPIESLENVAKVTVLGAGEGGISSERGVPMAARDIDPSHLGIIDPSRTPESSHAGIDQRFTISAHRDEEGNLYARVYDNAGKEHYLSVHEMMTSIVGFPNPKPGPQVHAQIRGKMGKCARKDVQYWLADGTDMYTITTNLVPYLNSSHPGRLTMAGKALPQALSLENREVPLVQTVRQESDGKRVPFIDIVGGIVCTKSPVDGVVTAVDKASISIKGNDGKVRIIKAVRNLPFNAKGFLDDETALVTVGQKVVSGQPIFDNNYTKDGKLALGRNLNVAFLPWKGSNHEDGIVIRRSVAESMTSHHAYKYDYAVQPITVAKKAMLVRYFPGKFTPEQLNKLDDSGYAKVGTKLQTGDPIYAVLERRDPTPEDKMLGRLHKTLVNPYRLVMEPWDHHEAAEVVDSHTEGKDVRILVRSVVPLTIGDKVTGLHGNKGVVSLIIDDDKMPYSKETGKPVDLILNPASVTSRINLGQIHEMAAGRIAQKTGKPYLVQNFEKTSNVKELLAEQKAHGIAPTEEIVDPETNKSWHLFTGPQYIIKGYKTVDSGLSHRSTGGYDANMQPTKGGVEGSKAVGSMEMLGFLGSNARHNLKEIATTKSEENSEYWAKFLTGQPLPKPKTTFATKKFFDYLTASGIRTSFKDGMITAAPLTNHDILSMSNGEIKEPTMISAKNLEPERGGLYDPSATGGLRGTKWSHYSLAEPIPNPIMEKPIKTLLGLTGKEFEGLTSGRYGVKKHEEGVYHMHDVTSGKFIKAINVKSPSTVSDEKDEEELDHDDEFELTQHKESK